MLCDVMWYQGKPDCANDVLCSILYLEHSGERYGSLLNTKAKPGLIHTDGMNI